MDRRPDTYIKTGGNSFLAFVKLIEALVACLLVIFVMINKDALIEQIQQNLFFRQLLGVDDRYRIYMYIIMGILIGDVVFMILDGFACLLTRIAMRGAGLVAFCHIVRCVFLSTALVVSIYDVFSKIFGINSLLNDNPFLLLGVPYFAAGVLGLLLVGIERIIGLFIMAQYHFGVFRIMHCVSKEIKAKEMITSKESANLVKERASHIAIFIIIGVIADLIGQNAIGTIVSAHALFTDPIYIAFTEMPVVCWIIMSFVVVKLLVVRNSARGFEGAHFFI